MSRNLVLLRAGDSSRHPSYTGGGGDFDVFLQYFGSQPGRYREDVTHYEAAPADGPRNMAALQDVLVRHPSLLASYDTFWFPDDDIEASSQTVEALFALHRELGLGVSQPALTPDSYYGLFCTLQHADTSVRYTNYVEVMAPLFSRAALEVCLPTFSLTEGGWGFDYLWPLLMAHQGSRMAVLDCLPVRHTRPLKGGEMYLGLDADPLEEFYELMRSFEIPAPPIAFDEVLDLAWAPVDTRGTNLHLLRNLPRPVTQPPHGYDGYVQGLVDALRADERRCAGAAGRPARLDPAHPLSTARVEDFTKGLRAEPTDVVDVARPPLLHQLDLVAEFDTSSACGSAAALEDHLAQAEHPLTPQLLDEWRRAPVPSVPEAALQRFVHRDLRGAHARGRLARRRALRALEAGDRLTVGIVHDDPALDEVLCAAAGEAPGTTVVVVVPTTTAVEGVVDHLRDVLFAHGLTTDDVDVEVRPTDVELRAAPDLDTCLQSSSGPWFASHPVPLSLAELRVLISRTSTALVAR